LQVEVAAVVEAVAVAVEVAAVMTWLPSMNSLLLHKQ